MLASPAAVDEPAVYAARDDSPPMPGVHQESLSDTVCATLVWTLAFRLSLVDPELERLLSRGASRPPDSSWKARYTGPSPSADTTKLVPNKDANHDALTQTSLSIRSNTITPMAIGGIILKDTHSVHICLLGTLR